MPSDTNPLPASEFRKLAHDVCFWHRQGGNDPNYNPGAAISLGAAVRALDAAMEASPVTLEEALVREMHEADEAISDAGSPRPDELTKRWNTVAAQLKRHARRLAGEGGAA